jgi:CBS domain-containing protein
MKEYHVKDLVIDDEYDTIESDATIIAAAKKMKKLGIPDLVVVEKETEKVIGVVADFDIVQNIVAEGKDPKTESVKSAMYVITPATLDTTVKEAFARMRDLKVDIIPVVEKGKLVGVCSIQDCWSYIPDLVDKKDKVGLIAVKDSKTAELWFGSICAIVAFFLGVILPLIGTIGFFRADPQNITDLIGIANVRGGNISFFLFDARGGDYIIPYLNLISRNGPVWLFIIIFNYVTIITGILALFMIIYASISEGRNIELKNLYQFYIPFVFLLVLMLQWVFFGWAFGFLQQPGAVIIDFRGLLLSIISMVLLVLAIYRDYIFRQEEESEPSKER